MFDLGRSFLAAVERRPHAVAVSDGALKKTYEDWFVDIQSAARGLQRLGLQRGDRMLVAMQNRWQMATLHWACQFAGVVMTPLNWRSTADELGYCIEDAQIRALAYDDATVAAVAGCSAATRLPRIAAGLRAADSDLSFEELCSQAPAAIILQANAEDFSLLLYTSGTTSKPKGVLRRHRCERAAAVAHVAQNLYRQSECTLGVMPLYHTMGVRSLLSMALIDGHFVCVPKFDVEATLQAIEREKVSNLYLVPTLYHMLIEHPAFARERVASVEKIGFAGAPMSDGLMRRVEEAFQPQLFVNHYGSVGNLHLHHRPASQPQTRFVRAQCNEPASARCAARCRNCRRRGQSVGGGPDHRRLWRVTRHSKATSTAPKRPPRRCVTDGISLVTSATSIWRAICSSRVGSMT